MRRHPPINLKGALQILGRNDRPALERLSKITGGAILAAGIGAGIAVVGGAAVAPLAVLAPIWGWVDQKNEAVQLVRGLLDKAMGRLNGTAGLERHQQIAAAHTVIAASAIIEVLRETVGEDLYKRLDISQREIEVVLTGRWKETSDAVLTSLYTNGVPAPCATHGFVENLPRVTSWMNHLAGAMIDFIEGLAEGSALRVDTTLTKRALDRYESHYLTLAASVPEFAVWAQIGEHAATRADLRRLGSALAQDRAVLARLESVLTAGGGTVRRDLCEVVENVNRAFLNDPVFDVRAERYETDAQFPSIGEIFINPRYRLSCAGSGAHPADEAWWENQTKFDDIDLLIATHVTAPYAFELPLLLLGHPGAGKSVLTKVLAARLPASSYTVVRVPLRRVDANAPVWLQIQQALDHTTHGRVEWARLIDESAASIRVVLLDGLDELLQATKHDRTGYLQEIADFQRREADQDRPVIVVVTSRTVVADRVDILPGTPIVKLEEFDKAQIRDWIAIWRRANDATSATGSVRLLTQEIALSQIELTKQPLLLLMLALYYADPRVPVLTEGLSPTDLYARLFDNFARREVLKRPGELHGRQLDEAVEDQVYRLSIAAIGMFNRGRQDISDDELGDDLIKLGASPSDGERSSLGQRVLAEFFFVHTAEAKVGATHRSYEFLHATFGEYLVATLVVDSLVEIADAAFSGRRVQRDPDDSFLHALLSHHTVATREAVLGFVEEIFKELSGELRGRISHTLAVLLEGYRSRHDAGKYNEYRPSRGDNLRRMSAYSANLTLLRLALERKGISLEELWGNDDSCLQKWRSMVSLWEAGLDAEGWKSMLGAIGMKDGEVGLGEASAGSLADFTEILRARLRKDVDLERRLRTAYSVHDRVTYFFNGDNWLDMMFSWIVAARSLPAGQVPSYALFRPLPDTPGTAIQSVQDVLCGLLLQKCNVWTYEAVLDVLSWVREIGYWDTVDPVVLAAAVGSHPRLMDDFPDVADTLVLAADMRSVVLLSAFSGNVEQGAQVEKLRRRIIARLGNVGEFSADPVELAMSMMSVLLSERVLMGRDPVRQYYSITTNGEHGTPRIGDVASTGFTYRD